MTNKLLFERWLQEFMCRLAIQSTAYELGGEHSSHKLSWLFKLDRKKFASI